MKILIQLTILFAICLVGQLISGFLPFAVPGSVISMVILLLLLLAAMAAVPLLRILLTAFLLKAAAGLLGVVSDKRITACADRVGNGSRLLFQTAGTAFLLFAVTISVAAYTTNRGF